MRSYLLAACLCLTLTASACGRDDSPETSGNPAPANSLDLPLEGSAQAKAVAQAQRTYAAELQITDASVAVGEVDETTWNDASLGCPEPNQSYAQVVTPGYTIQLTTADNRNATYHAGVSPDGDVTVVRCDRAAAAGSPSLGGPALDLAKADLDKRLGASAGELEVTDAFVAPVYELICDDEIASQPVDPNAARRAILEFHLKAADGKEYVYRSWAEQIKFCGTVGDLIIK